MSINLSTEYSVLRWYPRGGLLVEERSQSLATLLRQPWRRAAPGSLLQRHRLVREAVQQLLRPRQGVGSAFRERPTPAERRLQQLVSGGHGVDEPAAPRLLGVDQLPRQQQIPAHPFADVAQQVRHHHRCHQAAPYLGVTELRR